MPPTGLDMLHVLGKGVGVERNLRMIVRTEDCRTLATDRA
jgi:hypothetical protein